MTMKKNVGSWDSIIRVITGTIIVILGLFYDNYWGFFGLILVVSGAVAYCPVYRLFKFSTVSPDLEREN